MAEEKEVLLKVEHLCQYFKGVKAVDDVSFDVKKGEVFGLVGESGCGKTTTGRSIIKIYDITSGNIYFQGQRIGAGTKSYYDAIKAAKAELRKQNPDAARKAELEKIIEDNKKEIESAKATKKNCDKEFAKKLVDKLTAQYEQDKAAAAGDAAKLAELEKKYKADVKVAKKSKLVTKIQMIFQDPIASLNPRMTVREIIAEGLIIRGIKDKEYIDSRVYDILERVGLVREHAGRYPHEFSGGQRQRIGIARSIVMEPDMLIAD